MLEKNHANALLLERFYTAARNRDMELLHSSITEPFVAHTAGHSPIGGDFIGLDGFLGHIALLRELSGATLRRSSIEFYADDQWGFVPQVITATRNGQTINFKVAGFWRFAAPGKLAEHWEAVSDTAAWDAFWHSRS